MPSAANLGLFKPGALNLLNSTTTGPPPGRTFAETLAVTSGFQMGGNLSSLHEGDGNVLRIRNDSANTDGVFEMTATSPYRSPSRVQLSMELIVSVPFLTLATQFWNYQTNAWETVDTRPAPFNDALTNVVVTTNASRFVGMNNQMKARVSVTPQFILVDGWVTYVDRANWVIRL